MRRLKTHCKHGHEYTLDNTYTSPKGVRACRTCKKRDYNAFRSTEEGKSKMRRFRQKWLDKHPDYQRDYDLKSNYGISKEKHDQMLIEQDGCCAICTVVLGMPCVDHDHKTQKVRQLLCQRCNRTLGQVNDDPELLLRMVAYLKLHKEN